MECQKNTPLIKEVELTDVFGNAVTARMRWLTCGELWLSQELSGAKSERFNRVKLLDFMKSHDKTTMDQLTPEEKTELYQSDIWEPGDDMMSAAGRKQLLYQIAFCMGWNPGNEGAAGKIGDEGWTLTMAPSPHNILTNFSESECAKLIVTLVDLRSLSEQERKN